MVHIRSTLKSQPNNTIYKLRNSTLLFLTEAAIIRHITTLQNKQTNLQQVLATICPTLLFIHDPSQLNFLDE